MPPPKHTAPPKVKTTISVNSWLPKNLSGLNAGQFSIVIDWLGRGIDTRIDLDQLIRFPETIYEGRKEAPRTNTIISRHRDVRRFKSRKKFIDDLEGNSIQLVTELSRLGLVDM
jgi:hypothetical protein